MVSFSTFLSLVAVKSVALDVCSQDHADTSMCSNSDQDTTSWTVQPLPNDVQIGVEVNGLQLVNATNSTIDTIVRAMHNEGNGVLVVRGQTLDPQQLQIVLEKFTPHFGNPITYPRWPGQSKGVPCCRSLSLLGNYRAIEHEQFGMEVEVGEMIGEYKPATNSSDEWHTDGSFLPKPQSAIMLYHPDLGSAMPLEGGETKFASGTRFWESLSKEEQGHIAGLEAVHSWEAFMKFLEKRDPSRTKVTPEDCAKHPDVTYALVRTHPQTGKHAVYINGKNTKRVSARKGAPPLNWTHEEGLEFIQKLNLRIIDTGVYSHSWRRGDFLIWDNRVLIHAQNPFDAGKYERLLFRAEFPGEPVRSPELDDVLK